MDIKTAELLIDELGKRTYVITPDKEMFVEMLRSVDVPESRRFYEKVPYKKQELNESDRFYYLSLRRILRNRNVTRDYKQGLLKKAIDSVSAWRGLYSSNILARRLRNDKGIVDIIEACPADFSSLAKFQTYDMTNPDDIKITTRPVLVIPYAKEEVKKIIEWEESNTIHS